MQAIHGKSSFDRDTFFPDHPQPLKKKGFPDGEINVMEPQHNKVVSISNDIFALRQL